VRVYISCHHPDPANELADILKTAGHTVVSLWHREPSPRPAADAVTEWADKAGHNFNFIRACDVHVTVCDGQPHPGGNHRESGFAQGIGKKVAVVGPVENGMQRHAAVKQCADAAELLDWLAEARP
jgi:hypothetical protein